MLDGDAVRRDLAERGVAFVERLGDSSHRLDPDSVSLAAPCANCGEPPSAHTVEGGFGLVCPVDVAARTEDERFTYTAPDEVA